MDAAKRSAIALCVLVLVEYTLGGLVTFSDASNSGFALASFVTSWPGVLASVHRAFAIVLILLWILFSLAFRGTRAFTFAHMTLGLIVVQAVVGIFVPLTLGSPVNNYVVIAHFSVSALIIAATGFTAIHGWLGAKPSADRAVHTRQEAKRQA